MADKFPALDNIDNQEFSGADENDSGDFLAREQELLGNEFQTAEDKTVLGEEEDEEIHDFKEQYPEVDGKATETEQAAQEEEEEEFEGFGNSTSGSSAAPTGTSKHIEEWKERRDLEINEREKVNGKKKEEIITKAQQTIDDFYDNYNSKKEQHSKEILKEQEEFLAKRDGFLKRGTLWDRVNELVGEVGEVGEVGDKSRFKGLLTKLKGNEKAPGAGGY